MLLFNNILQGRGYENQIFDKLLNIYIPYPYNNQRKCFNNTPKIF